MAEQVKRKRGGNRGEPSRQGNGAGDRGGAIGRLRASGLAAFARVGFEGANTRQIAEAAGMSPAGVYIHFKTKGDLLYAIVSEGHEQVTTVISEAVEAAGPGAGNRMSRLVAAFSTWHAEHQTLARVTQYESRSLNQSQRKQIAKLRDRFSKIFDGVLNEGIANGEFEVDDPKATSIAIISMSLDIARWYRESSAWSPTELGEIYAALALRMLNAKR